jgi:hypothetical protein
MTLYHCIHRDAPHQCDEFKGVDDSTMSSTGSTTTSTDIDSTTVEQVQHAVDESASTSHGRRDEL